MRIRSACGLVALVVSLAACDLSTDAGTAGTFDAAITGDVTASMVGSAIFATSFTGAFDLSMVDSNQSQVLAVVRLNQEGRPGIGTYAIVPVPDEDDEAGPGFVALYQRAGEPAGVFWADSGEVVITSSTGTRIQGSLSFDGVGYFSADTLTERSISLTANFEARCVRTGGTQCN
jgi:hypothetical protein